MAGRGAALVAGLVRFLADPKIPLDTHGVERALYPMGRVDLSPSLLGHQQQLERYEQALLA